jgi:protein-tyrosine phosphatase
MDEALKMVRMAVDDGITHIFATPHIMDGAYDNHTEKIISSLNNFKKQVSVPIDILFGADIRISPDILKRIENNEIPALNGSGYLLLELPHFVMPPHVDNLIFNLRQRKFIPIIAHPERYIYLMNDFAKLKALRDMGVLYQITAMSITGNLGRDIRKASFSMIEKGLIDLVASDAHDTRRRPPKLSKAYREVQREFGNGVSENIFFTNQKKILEAAKQRAMSNEHECRKV